MTSLLHALRGAQMPAANLPLAAGVAPLSRLLIVGAGGKLGSAVLEQALVAGRFAAVLSLVDETLASAVRGFVPVPVQALQAAVDPACVSADAAVIVFERERHSNGRDAAFTQPRLEHLADLAFALKRHGVRSLVVVVPHAPALMPLALAQGLASLDEGAVAALGFEQLVFVRAAQTGVAARVAGHLPRLAAWCLSQLRFMVPAQDQALRSTTLANAVVQLARLLPGAPAGTRVLSPHALWPMTQAPQQLADAIADWLHGRRQP